MEDLNSHFILFKLKDKLGLSWAKMAISRPRSQNKKINGTLFSQTIKIRKNKVPLVLIVFGFCYEYGHFLDFYSNFLILEVKVPIKIEKIAISQPRSQNYKK